MKKGIVYSLFLYCLFLVKNLCSSFAVMLGKKKLYQRKRNSIGIKLCLIINYDRKGIFT